MSRRDELLSEIAREQNRIDRLKSELQQSNDRLSSLRNELDESALSAPTQPNSFDPVDANLASFSNSEKISLFRSLFRGREDVFPRRWENARNGKAGYSPACANDWKSGLCEKIGVKSDVKRQGTVCGNCSHQAFLPVSDEEIARHLTGKHVMGVYPLLRDETCWFLAADFDKRSWDEDVSAFARTCRSVEVPVAIERSRSGNGAHAWIFFSSPVQASVARAMGCFLVTETMARRHQMSMESYDRFFPNQDTLPRGGFGNLIALPLQREARERGNSVFVDSSLSQFPDQWAAIRAFIRVEPSHVQSTAKDALDSGKVFALRPDEQVAEMAAPPPVKTLGTLDKVTEPDQALPRSVKAKYSQHLSIDKAGLPSTFIVALRKLAAFQNPEFYRRQSLRLSTALTPRIISCFDETETSIAVPRGCRESVEDLLRRHGATLNIADERELGTPLQAKFGGTLTPAQMQAAEALQRHDMGVLVAPPGFGKTVIGIQQIASRGRNTLVLVHRKELLNMWVVQIERHLGISRSEIGQIGAGTRKPIGNVDVAMIQSLVRSASVDDLITHYGHIVADECHHLPAISFERVLRTARARYFTGLTATLQRRDGHHPIIQMQLGPVRFTVRANSNAARAQFKYRVIVQETGFHPGSGSSDASGIQGIYAALIADEKRNDMIFDDIVQALEGGRSPVLLTERRDHLEHFAERLRRFTRNLIVLHGKMTKSGRKEVLARISVIPDEEERLILATGRYLGEGFDDARLDTLFIALPVSWKGTLIQYAGRLHRAHPGKKEVQIYDYVDRNLPILKRMFERRVRGYKGMGYKLLEESNHGTKVLPRRVKESDTDTIEIFDERETGAENDSR